MSASDYEFEELPSAYLEEVDHITETQLRTAGSSSSTNADKASKVHETSDTIMVLSEDDEVTMHPPPRTTTSKTSFRPANSAAATRPTPQSFPSTSNTAKPFAPASASKTNSNADASIDFDDDWDEDDLAAIAVLESNQWKTPSLTRQTTLTGEIFSNQSQPGPSRTTSAHPFGKKSAKTKTWDRTAFSATGKRKGAGKGKRESLGYEEEEQHEEEEMDFEQFPAPFVPREFAFSIIPSTGRSQTRVRSRPPAMKLQADDEASKEWVYPLNHPKRDYQYNIVRNSLFENSLVALPTGLGKTFIAGVIMLNYYRWFPEGKVVFVAPTKPLVAQQIEACHHTCGIPRSDTVELTGQIPAAKRKRHWENKRVFFMTPQTLYNDMRAENCDVMDVVLLVVDEAHRATGGYAYSEVVRYLMAKNPHFRVLALSATPGGKTEAVQAVVDSLHISHIEIRNEDSLDLRQYIHKKDIVHTVVPMSGAVNKIKALLAAAMEPMVEKLGKAGIVSISDVVRLHPYRCRAVMAELGRTGASRSHPWAYGVLSKLEGLARAMGYLMEQSPAMCYKSLNGTIDPTEEDDAPKKKAAQKGRKPPKTDSDPAVKKVIAEIDTQRKARNGHFPNHPKLERLLDITLRHFNSTPDADSTRVMVFCTFRDCVDEIVGVLKGHSPTLRPTRFVGQGVDSSGKKGIAQKDQIEVVRQFKEGVFNILVATSIGEEGLDIGEVDLIVCYDSQKTPIRMLQRIGRTGRKRQGRIEVLSAAGREEYNYQKAGDSYKDVQDAIVRGDDLELYADVERLLPDQYKPQCVEKVMQIEEFVRDEPTEGRGKGRKRKTGAGGDDAGVKKKKRKSAGGSLAMDIPEGATKGFIPVNELIIRGAKGKGKAAKTSPPPSNSRLDEYDPDMLAPEDDDEELPDLPLPKSWTQSEMSPPAKASGSKLVGFTSAKSLVDKGMDSDENAEDLPPLKKKPKSSGTGTGVKSAPKIKAAATTKADKGKGKAKATPPLSELNATKPSSSKSKPKEPAKRSASPIVIPSSPEQAPQPPKGRPPMKKNPSVAAAVLTSSKPAESSGGTDKSMSWLLSDDDDDRPPRTLAKPGAPRMKPSRPNPPSPTVQIKPRPPPLGLARSTGPAAFKVPFAVPRRKPLTMPSGAPVGSSSSRVGELEGLEDTSFEIDIPNAPSSTTAGDDSMAVDDEPAAEDLDVDSSFDVRAPGFKRPKVPSRPAMELSSPEVSMSFPVRGPGAGGRLRRGPSRAVPDSDDQDESIVELHPPSPGHITVADTSIESLGEPEAASPPPRRPRRKQKQVRSRIGHAMFEMEAGHSGDEVSDGDTCSDGEYDTSFVTYGPGTQAPEGYDQTAMYRRGLMTQVGPGGPAFAKRPVRHGQFTGGEGGRRRGGGRSSDMSSEVGEYELGSFVVDDDDEEMLDVSMDSER